jgi:RHS repeat-associated protein
MYEHLEEFNLINMNGRMYDPLLARFLNVDPMLQDNTDAQNYNRYSYVLNNPTKYTDPSGYVYTNYDLHRRVQEESEQAKRHEMQMQFENDYLGLMETVKMNEKGGGNGGTGNPSGINGNGYDESTSENDPIDPPYGFPTSISGVGSVRTSGVAGNKGVVGWTGPANTWNGGVGLLAGALENLSGGKSIGTNGKLYSSGWRGNQFVSTAKVSKIGTLLGTGTLILGTIFDAYGVKTYYQKGANNPNAVHPSKAGTNLGVGLWGMLNPFTATGSAGYFLIDSFYPGGFKGAIENNYRLTQENRAILGPNFNLYNDMGGGW